MTALTLRLLGSALLVAAGAMLGHGKLAEMERRARCLRELCAALGRMEGEIDALQSPLRDVFSRLTDCMFFRLVSAGFGAEPLEKLWRRAAETLPLSEAERETLGNLGGVLGRCDAQRQAGEIGLVRRRLAESADALEREIAARGRRFAGLGAAFGAMLAAVLF